MTATSSPISIVFKTLYCVIKNIKDTGIINKAGSISFHEALARDPIVQNFIVIMLSELAPIEMIKLENALNRAFTTAPESIRLVVVIFLPRDAIKSTIPVEMTEPKKAPVPVKDFRPSIINKVAPNVAPADIPSIYGSEIGLLTVVCIIVPQSANPAPIKSPIITLGTLIFNTMATVDFEKALILSLPDILLEIILKVSFKLILTAPRETPVSIENRRNIHRTVSSSINLKSFLLFDINVFLKPFI